MKIALVSDIHCHNFTEFSTVLPDGMNSRLRDCLSVFDKIREHCTEHGIKHVLILGDIFHVRGRIDVGVYDAVYKRLKALVDAGIEATILVGNHDQAIKNGELHALAPFSEFAKVVDVPQWVTVGDLNCYLVPYIDDMAHLKDIIFEASEGKGLRLLGLHTGIDGAAVGSINYVMRDAITVEDLKPQAWSWVAMGHYHKPQFLAENVFYCGAPLQHNFGDEGDPRGFWVLDTKKKGKKALEFYDLTDQTPKFRTVEVKSEEDMKLVQDLYAGDFVRVRASDGVSVDRVISQVPTGVKARVEREATVAHESRIDLKKANTQDKLVRAFVEQRNPSNLDHERLVAIAAELMEGGV